MFKDTARKSFLASLIAAFAAATFGMGVARSYNVEASLNRSADNTNVKVIVEIKPIVRTK